MDNQKKNNQDPNRNNRQGFSFIVLVTLFSFLMVFALYQFSGRNVSEGEITYNEFLEMVDARKVETVEIRNDRIVITEKKEKGEKIAKEYYTGVIRDDTLSSRLYKAGVEYKQEVPDTSGMILAQILSYILPFVFLIGMIVWMTRRMSKGGGIMGVGKSNAKMYVEKQTGVTFLDVAGQDEAKESLQEVVDFLHNPG